ncbi:hypothetical protein [Paenibacillus sp. SN-8-1]|uniref:hypothetical protein n=1 Tax=Paenibacillus sp. SN-8-1 TaxID=3435409 RepID=UPI003D9A9508
MFDKSQIDNELEYQVIRQNLYNRLLELEYSPYFQVDNDQIELPNSGGVCVCYKQATGEAIVAYTNNLFRRYKELLQETRTMNTTHFCYALINDHTARIMFRHNLKSMFVFANWDKNNIIPDIK